MKRNGLLRVLVLSIVLMGNLMYADVAMDAVLQSFAKVERLDATIRNQREGFRADIEHLRNEFNAAKGKQQALMGMSLISKMADQLMVGTQLLQDVEERLSKIPRVGPQMKQPISMTAAIAPLPKTAYSVSNSLARVLAKADLKKWKAPIKPQLRKKPAGKPGKLQPTMTLAQTVSKMQRSVPAVVKIQKSLTKLIGVYNKSKEGQQVLKGLELVRVTIGPVKDSAQTLEMFFNKIKDQIKDPQVEMGIDAVQSLTGNLYQMASAIMDTADISEKAFIDALKKSKQVTRKGKAAPAEISGGALKAFEF